MAFITAVGILIILGAAILVVFAIMGPTYRPRIEPGRGDIRMRVEGPKGRVFRYSWQVSQGFLIKASGTATTKDRAVRKAQKFVRNSQISTFDYPVLTDGTIDRKTHELEQWTDDFQGIIPERER